MINNPYKNILSQIADALYVIDESGTIVDVNEATVKLTGYSQEELIGQPISLVDKTFKSSDDFRVQFSFMEPRTNIVFETVQTRKDGMEVPLEISGVKYVDDGEPKYVGLCRNISTRKKAESRYENLLKSAPYPIHLIDMNGILLEINDEAARLLGYQDKSMLVGKPVTKIDLNFSQHEVVEILGSLAFNQPVQFNTNFRHVDGFDIPMELRLVRVKESFDHEIVIAITRDLRSQLQYEAKILETSKVLKESQRMARLGSWRLNVTHGIGYWSDETFRIFGEKPQSFEVTGETIWKYFHPDEIDALKKYYEECVSTKSQLQITHRIITKDGQIKIVEENGKFETDLSTGELFVYGTIQDLTESEQRKRELKEDVEKFKVLLDSGKLIAFEANLDTGKISTLRDVRAIDKSYFPIHEVSTLHDFLMHIKEEHRAPCERQISKLQTGKIKSFSCEFQVKNAGKYYWHEGIMSVLQKDDHGKVSKVFVTLRNIEVYKNEENRLLIAQENERLRIARDIHDSIGQMLFATRMMLGNKLKKYDDLADIDEMMGKILIESRIIINNFGISLQENSLKDSFYSLAEKMGKVFPGVIDIKWSGKENMDNLKQATYLFRIFQEALSNAIKYSKSNTILIEVNNRLRFNMDVIDYGKGFDQDKIEWGFGLGNMSERAKEIGFQLTIESVLKKGTTIHIEPAIGD